MELTDENFEQKIWDTEKPVLIDFYADWCAPCNMLAPLLEKLAEEYKEKLVFAKVNLDRAPRAAQKYGVDRIPMLILFKTGRAVSGFVGVRPAAEIKEWLDKEL